MKNYIFYILIFSSSIWSQERDQEKNNFKVIGEVQFAATTNFFFGTNYLAKGHKNPSIGGNFSLNLFKYNNFKLGGTLEKSTVGVADTSIGGNSNKTNINSASVNLVYDIYLTKTFIISPQLKYGGVTLRQKDGKKFYGSQSGKSVGIGVNLNYKVLNNMSVFTNFGYNFYNLNTNTSPEFESYFDNSNSLNISLGIKL